MSKVLNMYFATHKTCNLDCKYCYVPKYNKDSRKNDDEAILKSLDEFIAKTEAENYRIGAFCLHGAEPSLLAPESLVEIANKMHEYWQKKSMGPLGVAIQSNGLRFDEKYLTVLGNGLESNKMIRLGFSIDPPKILHDEFRGNSYDKVHSNYLLAQKMGFPVSVLSVVSKETMNHLEEFAGWMKTQLENKAKYDNPYKIKLKLATGPMALSYEDVEKFSYFLSDNDLFSLIQILSPGYCLQAGNECNWYEFDIDGNCYSCNKAFFNEGIFANWKTQSFENIEKIRQKLYSNVIQHPDCSGCPYEFLCNSGCPMDRYKTGIMAGKAHECKLIKIAYSEVEKKGIHIVDFFNNNS